MNRFLEIEKPSLVVHKLYIQAILTGLPGFAHLKTHKLRQYAPAAFISSAIKFTGKPFASIHWEENKVENFLSSKFSSFSNLLPSAMKVCCCSMSDAAAKVSRKTEKVLRTTRMLLSGGCFSCAFMEYHHFLLVKQRLPLQMIKFLMTVFLEV